MGSYSFLGLLLVLINFFLVVFLLKKDKFNKSGVLFPATIFIILFIINSLGLAFIKLFDNNVESLNFIFLVTLALFSFFFGYFSISTRQIKVIFISNNLLSHNKRNSYRTGFICLFMLVFFFSFLYYQGLPELIFGLAEILRSNDVSDSASFISEQRYMLTKSHIYGGEYKAQGLLHELQQTGWRFVTVFSFICYAYWKNVFWRFSFLISLFCMVLFLAGTGERAPLILSILVLLIAYTVVYKNSLRNVLIFSVFSFSLLILTTMFSSRGISDFSNLDSYVELSESLVNRILVGNGIHDFEVINWVNSGKLDIRLGLFHSEKFLSSFPGINVGKPLGIITSELRGSRDTVFSSGSYLGFVYADFSYFGILIIYFLLGLFIKKLTLKINVTKKELLNVSVIVLLIFTAGEMTSIGFIGFFVQLLIILIFYYFTQFSAKMLTPYR